MPATLDDILRFLHENWPRVNRNSEELKVYFADKRRIAETERDRDLKKSADHLLADIHDESLDDQSRSREMTVARTMARFASLLVLQSQKADEQFRENLRIQAKLLSFTRATWMLAIVGILLAGMQVWKLLFVSQ